MKFQKNYFVNSFFLIYGLGKSGIASFKYLNKFNRCYIFDDNKKKIPKKFRNYYIDLKKIKKTNFDNIILSPGIDSNKCNLKEYLLQNKKKIITDFDIFYLNHPKIKSITITGTNGKSTTSKLIYDILRENKKDVRLVGNIGKSILSEKKITKKTIFIIEASSYQLDYSKYFKTKYAVILNLSRDHLDRHKTFNNYINAKFNILKNQNKSDFGFVENSNKIIKNLIYKHRIKSKIKFVKYKNKKNILVKNSFFENSSNQNNLQFVFEIIKIFKLKKNKVLNAINKFKGLNFRQQRIYNKNNLIVINDSKSTSFSSSVSLLENKKSIFWILGGLAKKNDKFLLNKKYYKFINGYVFGKDKNYFHKVLKNKIKVKTFNSLENSLENVFKDIKKIPFKNKLILFSPSAASFDQFKNFEERGIFFNKKIINKLKQYEKLF